MREEKTAEELYAGFNEGYEDFPLTYEWKNALEFAQDKYKWHSREEKSAYFKHLKGVMRILVAEGNTTRDKILCMAALHKTLANTDCTYEELEEKFGTRVAGCVQLLTRQPNQSFEEYSKEVFTNEEFPYARKIEIANRLYDLRNLPEITTTEELISKIQETETYILPYENTSPRVLMRKVREEIEKLKKSPNVRNFFKNTQEEIEP